MNPFINTQIRNMIEMVKVFNQSCELAARQDDGEIDKTEAKQLKKIRQATERFIRELENLK